MASGKTLQSTIEISGVLSPSLQAAINSAVDRLADMAEETLESADAASRLVAEMGAQEDILKSMQKAYAGYVASGQESSDEAQELASKIRTVSGELEDNRRTLETAERAAEQLTAEMGDTDDAFRKVGSAAEDAGNDVENSSEGYTVLKGAIADLVADGIEMALEAFKELATEGDTALGMLEARTGASAAKMEGFEDVMYEVYNANYGESLGAVSETLSTVVQMTDDLDNASLAKVTKNSIALSDVFGFDTMESLRAVNSLMDQFGITSDQAYNLIVQGAQNGLNQNDDLLDTINEYSVQFKDAGYTADDMFNMLANGAESGTWSVDKLGDAMKEFNIRMSDGTANEYLDALGLDADSVIAKFNKGGPDAQKAIGTVMKAIQKCDDATLQYQTGVGLFGTMWEDLGADTVASLMNTEGAISSTSDAMAKMDSAAYDTLESSLSQLGRTIKAEVVQPISDKLIPVAKTAVEFVTNNVAPAVDWILDNLPTIGVLLAGISAAVVAFKWGSIVSGITKAMGAVKAFGATLMSNPIGLIILAVTALVAAFTYLWNNCEGFRNFWIGLWDGIKNAVSVAVDWIKDCWEKIKAFFTGDSPIARYFQMAWENIKIVWNVVVSYFKTIWENIKLVFSAVKSVFTGDFSGAWDAVKQIFANWGGFFSGLWDNVKQIFANVADFFGPIFSGAWEKIKNIFAPVGEFFAGIWESVSTAFSNAWNSITSFLSGVWETIKNVVSVGVQLVGSILSAAFQIITLPFRFIWENCKEYVFAAWEWIKGKVSAAINAVKAVISTVWNAIKSVTSTVWNAIKSVISTVWNAISTKVSAVVSAVKAVISTVWNAIKSVTSTVWNTIKSVISTVWSGIKSAVSAAINAVKSVVSSVWNGIKSVTSTVWNGIKSAISSVWDGIKSRVSSAVNSVKSVVSSVWNGIKSVTSSVWNGIKNAILTPIEAAKEKIRGIIDKIKGFFSGMKLNLPKIKLPHFKVTGELSLNPPSVPKLSIDWYKDGGIMTRPTIFGASGNTLMAGGEAGAEAILPLAVLWEKMEAILQRILSGQSSTGEPSGEGLTSKAGELLTLDDFSLGSLSDGTNVVVYYDFSHFTWSPQVTGDGGEEEDDLMARLKAHEAEFFDWLEEFIQMREVAQYA